MLRADVDRDFIGSIPAFYQHHLVPLIFEPYAADIALRVVERKPSCILELAAGTGVVTRHLASGLPESVSIVATDLNAAMIDQATSLALSRPVEWRQADAMELPFGDGAFDLVVAQFGAMFFTDRPKAYAEIWRVLRPGGHFLFSVWDRIEHNEFADCVNQTLGCMFPSDPPQFLARVPYGYADGPTIVRDLAVGGFDRPAELTTVTRRARSESARIPALAYCQGMPLRFEIEARGPLRLEEATDLAAAALEQRFGSGPVDGQIQAHVIAVER